MRSKIDIDYSVPSVGFASIRACAFDDASLIASKIARCAFFLLSSTALIKARPLSLPNPLEVGKTPLYFSTA